MIPEERIQKFKAVLAAAASKGGFSIIITQVDPDALGGATAVKAIIKHLVPGAPVRVFYCGAFGHPQNRAIANKYDITKHVEPIGNFRDENNVNVVLVDSSDLNDGRLHITQKIDPVIIIDHHRGAPLIETETKFYLIEEVGAVSSLCVELFMELGLDFKKTGPLAVMLAMGIYTDTHMLVSADTRDRQAFGVVTKEFDYQEFVELVEYTVPMSFLDHLGLAAKNRKQNGPRLVAGLGKIDAQSGDDLSTIADIFIRGDGLSLVVIWGIINNPSTPGEVTIRLSARSENLSLPLGEFLQSRFGCGGAKLTPAGRGEGGALLKFSFPKWVESGEKFEEFISECIENQIFSGE